MKICGYIMLHYGKHYLDYVIRSIEPFCEKIAIIYSPVPSHGTKTNCYPPDLKGDLYPIAEKHDKVIWIEPPRAFANEYEHLRFCNEWCRNEGYDLAIRADSDEVFNQDDLKEFLKGDIPDTTQMGIDGFYHFWKSFNYAMTDGFRPIRFHNLKSSNNEMIQVKQRIYHFGYAQPFEYIEYKIKVHGHTTEWKKGWLDMYRNWNPDTEYLHPVTDAYWHKAEPFDKTTMPEMLKEHPFYNLEMI